MRVASSLTKKTRVIACLMFLSLPFSLPAAPGWYSIGLDDRAVNSILADQTGSILAGTDSGVSVYWNSVWYHIKMLPVKALARVSPGIVAAAAGNGSKSDGVYIGRFILESAPLYSFKLGAWITSPTALAASSALSASAAMQLFVGNGNSIAVGVIANDTLSKLDPIGMQNYAFGIEQPFCAALHIFGNRLYAGGYESSPMSGSSYLEYWYGDSMYPVRRMKTTAIAEGRFTSILGSGSLVMVASDADSGVFFYDQSLGEPWHRIAGPTGNPIHSIYIGQQSGSVNDNTLYAANKDGVFQCTSGEPLPAWKKLGTLSVEPLYITGAGSTGDLIAATVNGVYRYGEQGSGVSAVPHIVPGITTRGKRTVRVSVKNSLTPVKGRYNLQGRSIVSKAYAGVKASGAVVTDIR